MLSLPSALNKASNILNSRLTIYDHIDIGDPALWFTSEELTSILDSKLIGTSLGGLPLRTRSKVVKELICDALGYPRPNSFQKTQPRFPGQKFDTYVQQSRNLQVWNEELEVDRRYVIVGVNPDDIIFKVKVITGADLAFFDTTGTLTQKFQAQLAPVGQQFELISSIDTPNVLPLLATNEPNLSGSSPIDHPQADYLMPISECFENLKSIVGKSFADTGASQDRNRGAGLHDLVCKALGYRDYRDNGKFPDVRHQLLEVKLQTSPTIDLGLVCPDSDANLDIERINGLQIRHCDVRYAIFYGHIKDCQVHITNLYVTTGRDFFSRFTQFGGKVLNKKVQMNLPINFFND